MHGKEENNINNAQKCEAKYRKEGKGENTVQKLETMQRI